jgi:hypothetical protein
MIEADKSQVMFWTWKLGEERYARLLFGTSAVHEATVPQDVGELADPAPRSHRPYAKKSTGGKAPKNAAAAAADEKKETPKKMKK